MRTRIPIVRSCQHESCRRHRSPPHCRLRVGGSGLVWRIGRPRYVAMTRAATRLFVLTSQPMERDSGRLVSRCRLEDLQRWLVQTRSPIVHSRQHESCRRHRSPPHSRLRVGGSGLMWRIGRPRYIATTRAATRPFASVSHLMEHDGGRVGSQWRLNDC